MPAIDINPWVHELLGELSVNQQRQLVILQGSEPWCDAQLRALRQLQLSMLTLSNRPLETETETESGTSPISSGPIPFSKADACLGREAKLVVLDLFTGFNPDVLCIAAGLVQAGGILVVLSAEIKRWQQDADLYSSWQEPARSAKPRFAEYFFAAFEASDDIGLRVTPEALPAPKAKLPVLEPTQFVQGVTRQQADCMQRIEHWVDQDRPGVALIRAQRGRGKSSCLGMLVERLAKHRRVLVCADSRRAAAALLHFAPQAEFIAPDRLLLSNPSADLVVIDEAAMIAQSILRQINRLYPRLLMATTTGGYEGTGQGFMLRFIAELEARNLLQFELHDPVRWNSGDRLECRLNQVLLQDRVAELEMPASSDMFKWQLQVVEDPGAADFRECLWQVYRLLSAAHYRTRPSDLRMLMENPDLLLVVARCGQRIVGAVLLNREGGLDARLGKQIFLGRRRPRGHLLAQMLTAQAGIADFAEYRGLRVQRIAVSEDCRRRGLGTCLLERALEIAAGSGLDYLGASFALDSQTVKFWQQAGFSLVHVSYGEGKSSGNQSLAILRPLNPRVEVALGQLQQRIEDQLPTWMTQFLQGLDAGQVAALLRFAGFTAGLSELERSEIEAFAFGNKGFELCFVSLQKYVMQWVAENGGDFDPLLIEKVIQNRAWERLPRQTVGEGRKQLQKRLRGLVEASLKAC
jgi:tRNA(Met) cytidine acetyltransferase